MSTDIYRPDVVAGKYDPDLFDPSGLHLLVNEVFYTLQGEGMYAGRAAVFIRFAKCNLACKFCDTEFNFGMRRQLADVVDQVAALAPAGVLVVLSGGEPGLQNLGPLISRLIGLGYFPALETSGSVWAEWMDNSALHKCVSPKVKLTSLAGNLPRVADEIKWIVNAAWLTQFEKNPADVWLATKPNYLQPEWDARNPANTAKWTTAAVKIVQALPKRYRLSLQTHKLISIP